MRFTLPNEKRKLEHLNGHFSLQNARSCFAPEFAHDVHALLIFINTIEPTHKHIQALGTLLFVYELEETSIVGWEGIASREMFDSKEFRTENRNRHAVKVVVVDHFPTTHRFCVVAQTKDGNNELITVFPGRPAPPFPFEGQNINQKKESIEFWERHVLLREGS
jgi:hypothetical protein